MAALLVAATLAPRGASAQDATITVFAAASLQTALDEIAAAWRGESGNEALLSYAATSALARQIVQGAPADMFISADRDWMAYLADRDLVIRDSRTDFILNRLALVAPAGTLGPVDITPDLDLLGLLDGGRLALAETESVPAGRYAKAALESLGLWGDVAGRLAPAENVRAALALVARGEAPLGIVYATDDAADPSVEAIGLFPPETHPPIVYPAAIVAGSTNEAAAAFLRYLRSPIAQCIFEARGFTALAADGTAAAPVDCGTDD